MSDFKQELKLSQFEDGVVMATLPLQELLSIVEDAKFLALLLDNGVDNWEGFEDALRQFKDVDTNFSVN
jgi:hypothetical protein